MLNFQGFLSVLDIVGIIAFSISGAMVAIDEELDLFGVLFLGMTTAMGGGATRDVLMGTVPRLFTNYRGIITSCITSILVFTIACITRKYYKSHAKTIDSLNNIFDAAGLGVFTVTGIQIVISSGLPYNRFMLIFLGVTTAVGGGLIRDIIVSRKPMIFAKHIYAVASIIGSLTYITFINQGSSETLSVVVTIFIIFTIRMLATIFKWNLPRIRFSDK